MIRNKFAKLAKETENRRNGFGEKTIQGSFGETKISVPRDREGTFEPVIVPKRKKDVSEIEGKVLAMYARGMSQRDISSTIQDIYGFELSQDKISTITDTILDDVQDWLNRPLKLLYSFSAFIAFKSVMFGTVRFYLLCRE